MSAIRFQGFPLITEGEAQKELYHFMHIISEHNWSAGWLHDLEFILWSWLKGDGLCLFTDILDYYDGFYMDFLSGKADVWFRWDNDKKEVVAVPRVEWFPIYRAWADKRRSK